jgi:sporulation protein YlmC with PRC-barrel domain
MSNLKIESENTTGRNTEGRNINRPLKVLTAKSIIGDNIENPNGDELGTIKDLMVNIQTGKIDYVVLEYGGFLGIGNKLFAIPFEALQINEKKEVFILDKTEDYLRKAPGFDKEHWPETNSRHYGEVATYWGSFMGPSTGGGF